MSNTITSKDGRRKVRWVIAHFPVELFIRTAKAFSEQIEKLCPGQFDIEIITCGEYFKKYSDLYTKEQLAVLNSTTPYIPGLENPLRTARSGTHPANEIKPVSTFIEIKDKWKLFFESMRDGKFEMSQTQVNIVGHHLYKPYHAIDLPYIWNNHDHVAQALDGEIGKNLGNAVGDATGVRGMAFTYSGGYRIIGSTDGITSLNDLAGKKFITQTATSHLLFGQTGIDHMTRGQSTLTDLVDMSENGGAIETTYLRFEGKNILKTNHSMFMTAVLASDAFLNTLTDHQRKSWEAVSNKVSKSERLWSVEDAQKYENSAKERGITIVEASDEDKQRLRDAAQLVYKSENLEKFGIDSALVDQIINMGKTQ